MSSLLSQHGRGISDPRIASIEGVPLGELPIEDFTYWKNNCLCSMFQEIAYEYTRTSQFKEQKAKHVRTKTEDKNWPPFFEEFLQLQRSYNQLEEEQINEDFFWQWSRFYSETLLNFHDRWLTKAAVRGPADRSYARALTLERYLEEGNPIPHNFLANPGEMFHVAYTLGSRGKLESSEYVFKAVQRGLNSWSETPLEELEWKLIPPKGPPIFRNWPPGGINYLARFMLSFYLGLGRLYMVQERYDEAIEMFTRTEFLWEKVTWLLGRNRLVEALVERCKCYRLLGGDRMLVRKAQSEAFQCLCKFFRCFRDGEPKHEVYSNDWVRETVLVMLFFLDEVYAVLDWD